jgi:hypothetical protein
MKLSRTEANWIASKLLSDAERERECFAQQRTAWLTILFPPLKLVRPTERVSVLRKARQRAASELWIVLPSIAGLVLFAALYVEIPNHSRPAWLSLSPAAIFLGNVLAQYVRTRAILRAVAH